MKNLYFYASRESLKIGWGAVRISGGAVRSGVTPGAVRSGVIPPPKTTLLHAPGPGQGFSSFKTQISWADE